MFAGEEGGTAERQGMEVTLSPRRRRGGSLPPQDTLPEALETEEGEVGVEKDYEREPSAMED